MIYLFLLYSLLHKLFMKKGSRDDKVKVIRRKKFDVELIVVQAVEAFVESAPQLLLQLYIILNMPTVYWLTGNSNPLFNSNI